jgi:hypothetical protein
MLLLLVGCQKGLTKDSAPQQQEAVAGDEFSMRTLVKSDIDMVLDIHARLAESYLRELMRKLYLRNPAQWRTQGFTSVDAAVEQAFTYDEAELAARLSGASSVNSIQLAFDENFQGDRVLAFIYGLHSMLEQAHEGKREFYVLDQLDPQKLYNAARNIEVAVWKLSNDRRTDGRLFLISNETRGQIKNLSFERLFGKLIAIQDSSAQIIADKTNRTIKNVLQGVVRLVFLPI